ncbi:MAG: CotH kinase family protein [Prevotella sp.]|nr:CotH kinase family protein [Prevotella sp.]
MRLLYIDKLKALAMLLVVMGHTIYFCTWHENVQHDDVMNVICTFHVPLFFFLSGFVISQPPDMGKFLVKARKFLTPMLLVGFVNALMFDGVRNFFLNGGHFGYWYLLTLTIFYLLLVPFRLLNNINNSVTSFVAQGAMALAFWLLMYLAIDSPSVFISALNPWSGFAYWPFFIIGYFCRKYALTKYITRSPWCAVVLAVAYLALVVTFFSTIDHLPLIVDFTIALTAIAALLSIFYFLDNLSFSHFLNLSFSHSLNLSFSHIGNSTLHIYVYHYFFIRLIDLSFLQTSSTALKLLVIIPLTLAIAYGAMAVGKGVSYLLDTTRRRLLPLTLIAFAVPAFADSYDPDNYKPEIDTTTIDRTNLPIVFIDTSCGDGTKRIIHKDWRVAARMTIISNADGINYGDTVAHPNQTVDYDGWIAIRYRGNTSFTYSPKKPYNFKTMKTADPEGDKLKTELLGMPKDNTWVLLAPYGDRSLLRDVLVWQLARPYFDYTPRCRYCEMVLDGVYYGVFILAENIRKGKYRLDLDDPGTSGDALTGGYQLQIDRDDEPHFTSTYKAVNSNGKPYTAYNEIYLQYKHPDYEDMVPVQTEYIQQRVKQMEDALASETFTDPDTGYRQYLDPMSFIDQQLSQEFSGNVDGYRLSTNIYKQRDSQNPRFKTALWDFNLAFANSSSANAQATNFWRYQNSFLTNYNAFNKVPFWWMRLMEDPAYVTMLKNRYAQYRQENYSYQHIEATIDSITTMLSEGGALQRNNTTWSMFKSSTYDMEIDRLKQWIQERVAWMDEQLDYDPTGIVLPSPAFNKQIVGYYTLKGERISAPRPKEIIIVRYSDGTARKILPK